MCYERIERGSVLTTLFDGAPVYDPHLKSIMSLLMSRLRNNNPKPESKAYARTALFLSEIHEGRFLNKMFDLSRKDYDYDGVFEKVRACKGSWQAVRNIVLKALDNLELAKDFAYLPYNKKYIEDITLSVFFEQRKKNGLEPGTVSNFLNFVNPPKKKMDFANEQTVEKIKRSGLKIPMDTADRICRNYFKDSSSRLRFWRAMSDWSEWCSAFKGAYPSIFSEFCLSCSMGSPLDDFWIWLQGKLAAKKETPKPYHFMLSLSDSDMLGLDFLEWLEKGIKSRKFSMLRNLPKVVARYRFPEHFKDSAPSKPKKKEVVDAENLIF